MEGESHQQRVKRAEPGGGAAGRVEGVAVAVAGDERLGDAAGFKAEVEVVVFRTDAVGVADEDDHHPKRKGRPEDGGGGAEAGPWLAGFGLAGLGHW